MGYDSDGSNLAYGATESSQRRVPRLSRRLAQVVRLISLGCTNAEVARILNLSYKTVDNHRARAMGMLGVHNTAGITRAALLHGFSSFDDALTLEEHQRRTLVQ
jgi:DNA-binding CsgD family transcriptional regulator